MALVANATFKGERYSRIAILVPWAIPTVVSSQIWDWMFNDIYGVVNVLLIIFHLIPDKIAWLATPATAFRLSSPLMSGKRHRSWLSCSSPAYR